VERIAINAKEASFYKNLEPTGGAMDTKEGIVRYMFDHKPEGFDMAIADPRGIVIHSNIEAMPVGSSFPQSLMEAARRLGKDRILSLGVIPFMPANYLAVIGQKRSELIPRPDIIIASILVLAVLLAFTAAMCVLIVRSITKSVLYLEEATRRVAAGELDIPIRVEGSNEIASLSRSLDHLRVEVKEDQARRARFIMGISHDLKTPLALVKGYAEALEEELGEAEPSASAHLGIIQDKADQLEGMIDDLIDFERVDTGEWSRGLAEVDLASFLRTFAKRVEADAVLLGREIRSTVDLPQGAAVRLDERLVTRALENLVNNALRYTSPGDRISIEARAEGGTCVLSLSDDGPGISPEDLPHVFEPFYRGTASRRETGMGLGLSIVKTIVESHGWAIEAKPGRDEAGLPKGVAFVIRMPRSASAASFP
jgi:signal transduction histidine kinase